MEDRFKKCREILEELSQMVFPDVQEEETEEEKPLE